MSKKLFCALTAETARKTGVKSNGINRLRVSVGDRDKGETKRDSFAGALQVMDINMPVISHLRAPPRGWRSRGAKRRTIVSVPVVIHAFVARVRPQPRMHEWERDLSLNTRG